MDLILASGSDIRQTLLRNARVPFGVHPARIDETAIIAALLEDEAKPRDIADTLAEYKARQVAGRFPGAMVLGCDQILVCEGRIFEKPRTLEEAQDHLRRLRGRTHQLLSAVVVYENGAPVWRSIGRAQLTMRDFSDDYLSAYCDRQGRDLLTTVGCYKLESEGVSLFSAVQGDYFTILGLPLLDLLAYLRTRGVLPQ